MKSEITLAFNQGFALGFACAQSTLKVRVRHPKINCKDFIHKLKATEFNKVFDQRAFGKELLK